MPSDAWRFRELGGEDVEEVQELLEACADYFLLCFGAPPAPDEATTEFLALPDGATYEQKTVRGVLDDAGRLIGMTEEVAGWPDAATLMLGLVLLRPDARGAGLGSELLDTLEDGWLAEGFERVRVGVVSVNEGSLRFWRGRGYDEVRRVMRDDDPRPYEIVVLERSLSRG